LGSLRRGESAEVRIPLRGSENLATGNQNLSFTVAAGAKTLQTFEKTIALRKPVPATLQIADFQFIPSCRSDDVTLSVEIENAGDYTSGAAEALFTCPMGVKTAGGMSQPLGVVAARSRRKVELVFTKTPQFKGDVLGILCILKEGGAEKVRKTLEWQGASGSRSVVASGPLMIWTDPAPHELGTNKIRRSDSDFEFKMTVVSPSSLTPKDFKLRVNGVEMEGNKFNEEELSPPEKKNLQYTYTYKNKVPLAQGKNLLEVTIGDLVSEALEIEFTPERANLHVLAIGPNHVDLQFTSKDALDFANAFRNQGGAGRLFSEVKIYEKTTPEGTGLEGIKQAVYDFAYQWDDGQIRQNDLLLVFISSHGKIVDNRFKILQTGFNPKYERLALDYKSDVLEVLNGITCKKLIFIDACHSGGAKEGYGGLSQAVVDLAKAQPGVSTLTSCGSTEKSYEDKAWENGAFTEALLEAFSGKSCSDAQGSFSADADADGILRLGELYDFLRRRVPAMVRSAIPSAPTSQTPFMPESQLDRGLPVYYLR
ncbi:MAG: caspase family protein, partial [Bacteroidota bacterium]